MNLASKTKDIVSHFDFRFAKSLGQNFLVDNNVLTKIVDSAELDDTSCALEIGPGIGVLTQEMASRCKKVVAIEIDDRLIPILGETLSSYDNVEIVHSDALKVDFNKLFEEKGMDNIKVVANLPYYVTTPIINKIFKEAKGVKSITVMIQKEVAERLIAKPSTKDYGALTLLANYYSDVEKVVKAPPSCFIPNPKVESMVVKMNIKEPEVDVKDEKLFFRIIRDSFNMRRKTLLNSLKPVGLPSDKLKEAFAAAGIDEKRRGETLTIQEFAMLSNVIYEMM
ncbi:16S rRNA (adenine(1518)-N(6)/adenine(1519)-N(6))-dimethyltransferase RsmA [Clostridium cylindrosporum]|uniref:Ribosomal RNA small subunit methyltransferase A n=1 Tax=Clostridium cylindrosporum DSM 605 TaxID=1121307 RepID=A0A0J8DFG5_CLOCY|nr:16S rRNA (adenine(1518)-N(6)/adenine(1519)-N(6))-dimethyltransferase RsmA [Clostridium cylindrosporum]KMT22923.1 ribosomal RNA small subunit methyltransferase A [Clostridium cylindrosporum DSM 605]